MKTERYAVPAQPGTFNLALDHSDWSLCRTPVAAWVIEINENEQRGEYTHSAIPITMHVDSPWTGNPAIEFPCGRVVVSEDKEYASADEWAAAYRAICPD